MAEIFISYRHGTTDSWAATSIANRIEQHFPVFFDANRSALDPGDAFPPAIEDALHECKVLFAVIGPDWRSEESLRRLRRETDWVRRELRTTLSRPNVRVVPLLIEPATFPDAASLPEDVALILERLARHMSPARLELDCDELVQRLHHWLSGRAAALGREREIPAALPYLCDRKDQEEAFVEMVRTIDPFLNMLACVVHGHKWESHDELLERFRSEGVLEDIFGRSDDGVGVYPVQLNRGKLRAGSFADALKSAVKTDVLHKRTGSDDDLVAWFSTLLQPVVIVVQLTWSDYKEVGDALVPGLVNAWQGMLRTGQASTAGRPAEPALLWINLTYEEDDRELPADLLSNPLPMLRSVDERHIREWLRLRKVLPYATAKKQELLNVPFDSEYCHAPGQLHMMRFAQAVNRILSAP